jgi:MGT family glycosyltransferase
MSTIVFVVDDEAGHLLPSFKLARQLRGYGHQVYYLGLAGAYELVRRQGFELLPISGGASPGQYDLLECGAALDGIMSGIRPDALIVLSLLYAEALILHFRYRLPIVLLATYCRPVETTRAQMIEGKVVNRFTSLKPMALDALMQMIAATGRSFRSFRDLVEVVIRMPEMFLLPRAIELPGRADDPRVFYIGTGVDLDRREEPFPWDSIEPGRFLVYCSLGSQAALKPDLSRRFLQAVLGLAEKRPEWQLIVNAGENFDLDEASSAPRNVCLRSWIPQLEVLGRADLMINHGGPGTINECILMGVPMIVLPLMRDQFEMSRRVIHHGLGLEGRLPEVTAENLEELIHRAVADRTLKARVDSMRQLFEEEDKASLGSRIVQAVIAGETLPKGF